MPEPEIDLTKKPDPEVSAVKDANGELRVSLKLQAEDYEFLKSLNNSPYWKFYRKLLLQSKDAYFNSILGMKDTNEMIKAVGIVAGINLAVNQLPVLCLEYDRAQQKALEKENKKEVPFKRG